jgi:hypothetical protein
MSIWHILWSFGIFLPVLVRCTDKNLATLMGFTLGDFFHQNSSGHPAAPQRNKNTYKTLTPVTLNFFWPSQLFSRARVRSNKFSRKKVNTSVNVKTGTDVMIF